MNRKIFFAIGIVVVGCFGGLSIISSTDWLFDFVILGLFIVALALLGYLLHQVREFGRAGRNREKYSSEKLIGGQASINKNIDSLVQSIKGIEESTLQNSNRLRRLSNDQIKAFERSGREVREGFRNERDLIVQSHQAATQRQVTQFDTIRNIFEEIESGRLHEHSEMPNGEALEDILSESFKTLSKLQDLVQALQDDAISEERRISELGENIGMGLSKILQSVTMIQELGNQVEDVVERIQRIESLQSDSTNYELLLEKVSQKLVELKIHMDAQNTWNVGNLATQLSNYNSSALDSIEKKGHEGNKAVFLEALEESQSKLVTDINSNMLKNNQKLFNKLQIAMYEETQETEALLRLESKIKPRSVLPSLGRWAMDAKSMLQLVHLFDAHKPSRILEIGSGTSSVWLGYLAEKYDSRVVSIEHQESFAERTRSLLKEHSLSETVEVIHAPLNDLKLGSELYSWYDTEFIQRMTDIDLLVVDGPVGTTSKHARYPALPLLMDKLTSDALVILDDTQRKDEAEIAERWASEYSLQRVDNFLSRLAVLKKSSDF